MKNIIDKIVGEYKKFDWMFRRDVFLVILCIPVFYLFIVSIFTYKHIEYMNFLSSEVVYLEKMLNVGLKGAEKEQQGQINDDYVKKFVEDMSFLSLDRQHLALLCTQIDAKNMYQGIKERLAFLESGKNKLKFTLEEGDGEVIWHQKSPVEMSCRDIKKLITLIEGRPIGEFYPNPYRPDIYFSKLKFKRINKGLADVFIVEMKLLQKRNS